jgi:hypothetical protein
MLKFIHIHTLLIILRLFINAKKKYISEVYFSLYQ